MDLTWGGGSQDIVLDLATGAIFQYASEQAAVSVHATYGGKNYYRSLTGMSGAGFVPDRLGLVKVGGYRVGTPTEPWASTPAVQIAGWGFSVPYSYGSGETPNDWPIVANQGNGSVLLAQHEVLAAVRGQITQLHERSLSARFVKRPGAEAEELTMRFWAASEGRYAPKWPHLRRLLEALNKEALRFEAGDGPDNPTILYTPFWRRLGLYPSPLGDRVYKISFGICRASYSREELGAVAGLQAAVPKNVHVLASNVYIQGSFGSGFQAVGLFNMGEEVDFEIDLPDEARVVRALGGDFAEIVAELEAGAREKAAEIRRQAEERVRYEAEREAEYRRTFEANLNQPVTREEATRLGTGYPAFIASILGDRESIPVAEFAGSEEGSAVLRHYIFPDRQRRASEAARKLAETDREGWFRQACERHGEVIVTFADSRAAGNCDPGTRDFRDRTFPGRDTVTIRELANHSRLPQVRRVIEWKLRQLGA